MPSKTYPQTMRGDDGTLYVRGKHGEWALASTDQELDCDPCAVEEEAED